MCDDQTHIIFKWKQTDPRKFGVFGLVASFFFFLVSLSPSFVQVQTQCYPATESGSFHYESALPPNLDSCTLPLLSQWQLSSHEGRSEFLPGSPFSLVPSPHFHIFLYSDYLHLVEITDKLLKRATWDGLISHFTGLHTKELRLSFLKVLHVHPNIPRHLQNQSSLYPRTSDDRQNLSGSACSGTHPVC